MPRWDTAYLIVSGASAAPAVVPPLIAGLAARFPTVLTLPTPHAARVLNRFELSRLPGHRLVESYFDAAILPQPADGLVLVAPCSFNSLNKLAGGIADSLALSLTAEAIGRGTPVIVGPSLNAPLLAHPVAQASLKTLTSLGVTIVPPVDEGEGPRLAPTGLLIDAVRPRVLTG